MNKEMGSVRSPLSVSTSSNMYDDIYVNGQKLEWVGRFIGTPNCDIL
jgi:hypothetical protein